MMSLYTLQFIGVSYCSSLDANSFAKAFIEYLA